MSKNFSPGMRVIIRDEEWMIKKVETNNLERKAIFCIGISTLVKDRESIFLTDLEDIEIIDPAKVKLVIDNSPNFKKSRLYIESQWRQKTPTDTALHIGNKAAMDLMQYQLKPAQCALNKTRQRILIADSTGLGKTLEAGILMSELILRGKGKRILVVSSKSMMTQFQKEMWNRFSIPLVRLDSSKISKIRSSLPSNYNPFFYFDKAIVSVDTLKRDIEYRAHLESAKWDIIVIDEAQNVAERGTQKAQRSKLAKLLSARSDTLIMLSATPHDGRPESFASLMNMLDPTAIANPSDYTKDDIKGLCIRRFKKDIKDEVQATFQDRTVNIEKSNASIEEENAFEIFTSMNLKMDENNKNNISGQLFKTSLEKSLFSSPAACIKSINERLRKLESKNDTTGDIEKLQELKSALELITPSAFSRYNELFKLLKDTNYDWNVKNTKDRIVIFTERIETMKFLSKQLKKDLNLNNEIQEIHGGMNDIEQQKVVDDFSREDSPVRILVASDVASEGINLHYLCHRLIHFDIPWSLMVFQQRNGRIDRYGQTEKPDIRYFMINSSNPKIKGDTRIMEILIEKEQQAYKNIGDPASLMGKFNIEEEELSVASAIESNKDPNDFANELKITSDEFDPFEIMMKAADDSEQLPQIKDERTLYSDLKYLESALGYFSQTESYEARRLETVPGLDIKADKSLKRRLDAILPSEVMADRERIKLSPDKQFCMDEMKRSMQNNMSETAWPSTQYLWKIHPVFDWVNDKVGLLFNRSETPFINLDALYYKDFIFVVAGLIPNRKSTPVIDEWFGLHFSNGKFIKELSMQEVITMTEIDRDDIPNRNNSDETNLQLAESMLPEVVLQAKVVLNRHFEAYKKAIDPRINEELDKLDELRQRKKHYQLSLFESERKKSEKEREVDKMFDEFVEWVTDTLDIQDNPYLRVVAVMAGA